MKYLLYLIIPLIFFSFSCNKQKLLDREDWLASPENIYKLCGEVEKKIITKQLDYAQRQDCAWGATIDGVANLSEKNGNVRARSKEVLAAELPDNSVLCGVNIESQSNNLHYDDVLFFTMNGFLLVAGSDSFVPVFDKKSGIPVWSFLKIRDLKDSDYPWNSKPYCVGGSQSTCVVPEHDNRGPFNINIDPVSLSKIASMTIADKELSFALIVTGDNVDPGPGDGECFHTDFILDLTLEYATLESE